MSENVLIELGGVSEETKGCSGGIEESVAQPFTQPELPNGKCPD